MSVTPTPERPYRACGRPISFIRTSPGLKMAPVDPLAIFEQTDPGLKWYDQEGVFHRGAGAGETGYVAHHSTCSDPGRFKKPKGGPTT